MNQEAIIYHLPHSSTKIPEEFLVDFSCNTDKLQKTNLLLTDLYVDDFFSTITSSTKGLRFNYSRLIVDVERFLDARKELLSAKGMGAFYTHNQIGEQIRKPSDNLTKKLLPLYMSHHQELHDLVASQLKQYNQCLILDLHSFASQPLPYELDQRKDRPDICIGYEDFHKPKELAAILSRKFKQLGYRVAINHPFTGSIVPMAYYQTDSRVKSIMIEVNKKLYLNEATFTKKASFLVISQKINQTILESLSSS